MFAQVSGLGSLHYFDETDVIETLVARGRPLNQRALYPTHTTITAQLEVREQLLIVLSFGKELRAYAPTNEIQFTEMKSRIASCFDGSFTEEHYAVVL